MDKELITYLQQMEGRMGERFAETDRRIQSTREEVQTFREETAQGFKEVKDDIRGAHVAVEGLREVVRQVAEGVDNTNEILGRYKEEVSRDLTEVESRHRIAYRNLEGRVDTLEKARKQAGN